MYLIQNNERVWATLGDSRSPPDIGQYRAHEFSIKVLWKATNFRQAVEKACFPFCSPAVGGTSCNPNTVFLVFSNLCWPHRQYSVPHITSRQITCQTDRPYTHEIRRLQTMYLNIHKCPILRNSYVPKKCGAIPTLTESKLRTSILYKEPTRCNFDSIKW